MRSWKPTRWEAEDRFIIATIERTAEGFAWRVFSKPDDAHLTDGVEASLGEARKRCEQTAGIVADAEGHWFKG